MTDGSDPSDGLGDEEDRVAEPDGSDSEPAAKEEGATERDGEDRSETDREARPAIRRTGDGGGDGSDGEAGAGGDGGDDPVARLGERTDRGVSGQSERTGTAEGDDRAEADGPFGALAETVEDREGDPFAGLDGPATGPTELPGGGRDGREADETETGDATVEPGETQAADDRTTEVVDGPTVRTETSDEQEDDPFAAAEELFERMDVGEVDPDEVWERLSAAQDRGSVAESRERSDTVVSKHTFCEQCEHFSEPPDVGCTHEGTEILEFPAMGSVRVLDCPVVAERRSLEEGE